MNIVHFILIDFFFFVFPQQDPALQTPSTVLTRTRTTAWSVSNTTRKPAANLSYT